MLVQLLLVTAILFILIRFLSSQNSFQTQAWKKILLLLFSLTAIILVISPNLIDGVAHFVGVGRGADLLLYALTIAFIFQELSHYIKSKEEQKRIAILARKIAIVEALLEHKDD